MKKTVSLFLAIALICVLLVPCVASASSIVDLLSEEIVYGAEVTENSAVKKLDTRCRLLQGFKG